MPNYPDRVRFPFGDADLSGHVVGALPAPDVYFRPDRVLRVAVDGQIYRTLESDATVVG